MPVHFARSPRYGRSSLRPRDAEDASWKGHSPPLSHPSNLSCVCQIRWNVRPCPVFRKQHYSSLSQNDGTSHRLAILFRDTSLSEGGVFKYDIDSSVDRADCGQPINFANQLSSI